MSPASTLRALILDYGQVLSLPQDPDALRDMARVGGVPPEPFQAAYWRHRPAYDRGLPAVDYWRRVLADTGAAGGDAIVPALIDRDVASWTAYRDEVWTLAADAHARGLRTAILSNGVPEVMVRVARERPLTIFDAVIVSCEVDCAKPDPAIYLLTLTRLGVPASDALFVDDRLENIDAARAVGLTTLHFDEDGGLEALRRQLA
jgi:putative hydrolase of the HAD superfamily